MNSFAYFVWFAVKTCFPDCPAMIPYEILDYNTTSQTTRRKSKLQNYETHHLETFELPLREFISRAADGIACGG